MTPRAGQRSVVTVLAVDDQPVFRHAARELIAATEGFQQVAEAASGPQALRLAAALRPDLVLLDVRMPGMDGLETARKLTAQDPGVVVVLISLEPLVELPAAALNAGAAAHIPKQDLSPRTLHQVWATHGAKAHAS